MGKMAAPRDHLELLRSQDFIIDCAPPNLSRDERGLLQRYGRWLTALAAGTIQPFTDAQRRFLEVVKGKRDPTTSHEIAWMKLVERRRIEAENRSAPHYEVSDSTESFIPRSAHWRNQNHPSANDSD